MGNPLPVNLAQECRKAHKILTEFVDPAHGGLDRVIPVSVLKKAQGFAIFSVARLGFLVSARAGSGVVIARLPDNSWSAPSALGLGGLGGGFNVGLDVTDFLIILNSSKAVRSFMATGSLQLGGNLSVAVGPLGRAAEASGAVNSSGNLAAMYSYSKSKGLYGGVSVEGTILVDRSDANSKAYDRTITAKQILSGGVEAPAFAQPLISTIEKFTFTGEIQYSIDNARSGEDEKFDFDDDGYEEDINALNHDMASGRIASPNASRKKNQFVDDYESRRPGDYAFGNSSGASHTNSPTQTRRSFLGGAYGSGTRGSDYANLDNNYSDRNGNESPISSSRIKIPFVRSRSSTGGSGSIFGDEGGSYTTTGQKIRRDAPTPPTYKSEASNGRGSRTHRATSSFPTQFSNSGYEDEDAFESNQTMERSSRISEEEPQAPSRDSWDDEALRRKPHAAFSRAASNDLLDFELDRSAVTQRQAPRPSEKNLIDFGEADARNYSSVGESNGSRRKTYGMDELDKELQARTSMSSLDDSLPPLTNGHGSSSRNGSGGGGGGGGGGWRSDYGLPAESSSSSPRPKMHTRTSSTQKIFNRLRGNSQSSKNAFVNMETWDQKYTSPSQRGTPSPGPDRSFGSATPPAFKASTPTGFKTTTPTGFKSTPPMSTSSSSSGGLYRKATTPTGFRRSSNTGSNLEGIVDSDSMLVIATFQFDGQEEDDLSFKRGDIIEVVKRTVNRDDWWQGRNGDALGNFPANYTEDV
ncbi:hypothetical protein CBS101457_003324 [Exobasidium rhododendri]|nr:hypothetical protein CBS101457_003324 [Exobasidium rhododendri]